jgi:hypothetical protein
LSKTVDGSWNTPEYRAAIEIAVFAGEIYAVALADRRAQYEARKAARKTGGSSNGRQHAPQAHLAPGTSRAGRTGHAKAHARKAPEETGEAGLTFDKSMEHLSRAEELYRAALDSHDLSPRDRANCAAHLAWVIFAQGAALNDAMAAGMPVLAALEGGITSVRTLHELRPIYDIAKAIQSGTRSGEATVTSPVPDTITGQQGEGTNEKHVHI